MHVPPEHRMPQWTDSQTGPLEKRNEERASAVKIQSGKREIIVNRNVGRKEKEAEKGPTPNRKGPNRNYAKEAVILLIIFFFFLERKGDARSD